MEAEEAEKAERGKTDLSLSKDLRPTAAPVELSAGGVVGGVGGRREHPRRVKRKIKAKTATIKEFSS
jgi:hypothetical protein